VAWTIDRSVKDVHGGEDAVSAAIAAWTGKAGAPSLSLAKKGAKRTPGLDGTNAVFFAKDGYAPAGVALAVTVLSFDEATGEVLDADIILNGKYEIGAIDGDAPAPTAEDDRGAETYDVVRIVAHEMGHALALSDELQQKDALMYPYVARAHALPAKPGADDLAGLATLYTAAPATSAPDASKAGCGGAVVARSGPGSAPGGAWCALGLAVTALVLARSRRRGGKAAAGCTVLAAVVMVMPAWGVEAPTTMTTTPITTAESESIVTDVSTTMTDGIFRSEVVVMTDGVAVSRHEVWGGALAGIRQTIGGAPVPVAGDRVRIVVASRSPGGVGALRLVSRRVE